VDRFGGAFKVKTVDVGQRIISGWAAYHNNVDRVDDIIEPSASVKAVARLKSPADVGVFIGHDLSRLPVGVPVKIEAYPEGLYVETKIFEGPTGDDLLGAARGLRESGGSLGMSIGYRLHDGRRDRVNGKMIRRITDYSLHEYSFAASQAIANPSALVTGVKSGGSMQYTVKEMAGRFHVMKSGEGDKALSLADFATQEEAEARCDELNSGGDKTVHANQLPDSAFLYIAPGGLLDDEGKTVPRSFRHFRFRDAAGMIDDAAIASVLVAIPQAKSLGLSAADMSRLQARARMHAEASASEADAQEWKTGVPISLRGVGYRLIDLSDQIAAELKAMALLGEDTKTGQRMRVEMRHRITDLSQELREIVELAERATRGEDGQAKLALYARELEMLGV